MKSKTANKTYTPYGGARAMWCCKARELLFDGAAGTGKTRAVIEKAVLACMKYPGARVLFVRKTRASQTESTLVTLERDVLPDDSPIKAGAARAQRQAYHFPNGSELICGGLDNVDRIMSTEYDLICLFEATEATLDDWEKLLTRLRNGVMPYQQAIADCNPSYPGHWLKKRSDEGKMKRIQSVHEDNPSVTSEYLESLNALSGHRRSRLYLGKWVAAEGLIYDTWRDATHIQRLDTSTWSRTIIGIDEGYANPCAMHVYRVDGDGRMHVQAEWYERGKKIGEVVSQASAWCKQYDAEAIIVDPSAPQLIADLEAANLPVYPANNDVFGGIQVMQQRLVVQPDGKPRLTCDPDCTHFIDEVNSYAWKQNRDGSMQDKPDKTNDHAMDECRYVCNYLALGTVSTDFRML